MEKLKAAEPWLFEADGKHAAKGGNADGTGTTGLPNTGTTSAAASSTHTFGDTASKGCIRRWAT